MLPLLSFDRADMEHGLAGGPTRRVHFREFTRQLVLKDELCRERYFHRFQRMQLSTNQFKEHFTQPSLIYVCILMFKM